MNILISSFPVLLLIGVWIYFMRQMQGGGRGGAFSFGKSRAKMLDESTNPITFVDVAGCDEAKEEVSELVDFLRDPSKFQKLGGRIPRGVLMVGSPGTGKTLLARAIAGEAKVPFFSISGSDFVEMFVGVVAASRFCWCICARCRSHPTSMRISSPAAHPVSPVPILPISSTRRPCLLPAPASVWSTWKISRRPRTRFTWAPNVVPW